MVPSFISSNSFSKLFTRTNSSWLIFKSIKALEIKAYILLNLDFSNNTLLLCFFFFLIIDLYLLIPAVITQICNPTVEIVMSVRKSTKEAKAEIKTSPVTVVNKISKYSI